MLRRKSISFCHYYVMIHDFIFGRRFAASHRMRKKKTASLRSVLNKAFVKIYQIYGAIVLTLAMRFAKSKTKNGVMAIGATSAIPIHKTQYRYPRPAK